jgi:tetratricopeptide (TPR) repeat protein
MRPSEKGWLKDYLDFRKDLLLNMTHSAAQIGSHPEHSLYRIIQPTGLMYGQTVSSHDHPDHMKWNEKDKMKVLLAESLISSSLLFHNSTIKSADDMSGVILRTLENIGNFYNNIFPELNTPAKSLFGKKKTPLEVAEKILDKRIERTSDYQGNFWTYFFHNSLLFLDVFIFGQWIHTNADKIVADFFRYEREELRFSVVKVIAAASHANKEVVYEEKKLLDFFLHSTDLSSEKRKEAIKIFERGIDIDEIHLPAENSWILKKFFLEMAVLTIWADKRVEQGEMDFLKRFSNHLGFGEEDLENSLIAIEGFVLEHWEQLEHLQNKQDYNQVSEQFIKRVARIAEKNKGRLMKELQESEEMMTLLKKARSNELTLEEKEKMRTELIAILKKVPTFVIISLPQKFLTLPILLKILPRNIFSEGSLN